MATTPRQVYPNRAKGIWVLYDLRCPEACQHLHQQRATWQELSDLAAFGPDHMILILSPGGASGGRDITKEVQRGY